MQGNILEACVVLFTGGSLYDVTSCLAAWSNVPSGAICPGGSVPPLYGGQAGSTHPTGMLCCLISLFFIVKCFAVMFKPVHQSACKLNRYTEDCRSDLMPCPYFMQLLP